MTSHITKCKFEGQKFMEAQRLKSDMGSWINHECGNALATIRLGVTLLRESEPAPMTQQREKTYSVLERMIWHLTLATTNYLHLERLESGHFTLNIGRTRLEAVIRETLQSLRPLIESEGLRLEAVFPEGPVDVRGDAEALFLIASNLIANAAKYAANGKAITARVTREGGHAIFAVDVDGIGIDAQDRERILAGLRTEESLKAAKDFGIGLMLVKKLIEQHGSHLEIQSCPDNNGSRFYFSLPLWGQPQAPRWSVQRRIMDPQKDWPIRNSCCA